MLTLCKKFLESFCFVAVMMIIGITPYVRFFEGQMSILCYGKTVLKKIT